MHTIYRICILFHFLIPKVLYKIQQNFHEIQVNQTQIFMKRIEKHQETVETRRKVAKISFSRSSLDGPGHVTRYPDWPLRIT